VNDNITLSDQASSPTNKTFNLARKGTPIAKDTFETLRKTDEFDDTPETISSRARVTKDYTALHNSVQYRKVSKNATTGKRSALTLTLTADAAIGEFTQAEVEAAFGYLQSYMAQSGAKAELAKGIV